MNKCRIRNAVSSDAPRISSLLEQMGYPATEDFLSRHIRIIRETHDDVLIVAEFHNEVAGFLSGYFARHIAFPGSFARLAYLCVDKAARSSGIGRLLVHSFEGMAAARGCERIELHSNVRRVQAHEFYINLGYKESPKYFEKSLRNEKN